MATQIKLISFGKSSRGRTAEVVRLEGGHSTTLHLVFDRNQEKGSLWSDAKAKKYLFVEDKFHEVQPSLTG